MTTTAFCYCYPSAAAAASASRMTASDSHSLARSYPRSFPLRRNPTGGGVATHRRGLGARAGRVPAAGSLAHADRRADFWEILANRPYGRFLTINRAPPPPAPPRTHPLYPPTHPPHFLRLRPHPAAPPPHSTPLLFRGREHRGLAAVAPLRVAPPSRHSESDPSGPIRPHTHTRFSPPSPAALGGEDALLLLINPPAPKEHYH